MNTIKNIIFDIKGVLIEYDANTDWLSLFAGTIKENPFRVLPGIAIFEALYEQYHEHGYAFYILSNFKDERFTLLKAWYPEIFNKFNGIVLSDVCGYAKPDARIFHHLCNTYGILPEESIFLDDQEKNITAAQALGMKALLCNNFETVKEQLTDYICAC
jgi:FMN phosphatase YigB (HAD superfamily)